MSSFDLFQFPQLPLLGRATGLALANALIAAAPGEANPNLSKAVARLRATAAAFQQDWAARGRLEAAANRKTAVTWDRRLDSAWGSLAARLEAYARLPVDCYPKAARAAELFASLYPSGLSFVQLPFTEEWAHSEMLIMRIDGEGLAGDLDALAGPEFLEELRRAHQRYGETLGKTAPLPVEEQKANLLESLRALADAIRRYTLQVIAAVDAEHPLGLEAARAALGPIDDLRGEVSRRRPAKTEKPQPTDA